MDRDYNTLAAGVAYCVIDLPAVKSAADLGDRVKVVPNVKTLTPAQAIALEEWMSQGGRVIASGPVGNLPSQECASCCDHCWGLLGSASASRQLQPKNSDTGVASNRAGRDCTGRRRDSYEYKQYTRCLAVPR